MSVCFLFPGQGAQSPGMLGRLPAHAAVDATMGEARSFLGSELDKLDSEDSLRSTVSVQLALFISGVAVARVLAAENIVPIALAGMSIGAFAAAVHCGTLSFRDGIALVKKRATLMEESFKTGFGMSAIVGLSEQRVAKIVHQCFSDKEPIYLSNINSLTQIVISGCDAGLDKVEAMARENGAQKAERLKVAVPSHCPLFADVAETLLKDMSELPMAKPNILFVGNVRARSLRTAQAISEDLANNIAHGVRWYDTMSVLIELGGTTFVEMNPGHTLSRLGAASFPHARFIAVEDSSIRYVKSKV